MAEQGAERQLVAFDLTGEVYGVQIETVRAIIRVQEVTCVPDAPDFVEGVIKLRGRVIPVVDLRWRFGLAMTEALRIAGESIELTSSLVTTEDSY